MLLHFFDEERKFTLDEYFPHFEARGDASPSPATVTKILKKLTFFQSWIMKENEYRVMYVMSLVVVAKLSIRYAYLNMQQLSSAHISGDIGNDQEMGLVWGATSFGWKEFSFQLQNQGGTKPCLDRMGAPYGNEIGTSGCHGYSSSQVWFWICIFIHFLIVV